MQDVLAKFRLDGQVALVTGASSGLGHHFAQVLAAAGARVVLAARRVERIEAARDAIIAAGGEAIAVAMDVTDTASIRSGLDAIDAACGGPATIVINNAGVTLPKPLLMLSDADWNAVVDTNLNGVAWVLRETARRMVDAGVGGSIVNIASILAVREQKALTSYAAAKAGVVALSKVAALELAGNGIRVNALCPGYFNTELNSAWFETEAGRALAAKIPMGRIGRLDELDGPLLLLASEAGALMTGASIVVDGGHVVSDLNG